VGTVGPGGTSVAVVLTSDEPRAAKVLAGRIQRLAGWNGYVGAWRVVEGDATGWEHIERGRQYLAWRLRIGGEISIEPWNQCFAHAVEAGDNVLAGCLAAAMPKGHARWRENPRPEGIVDGWILGWDRSHFAPFILYLWAMATTTSPPTLDGPIAGLGPYRAILESWHDEERLATAVVNACDYHLEHATYSAADKEFLDPPYSLFPVDILAIARVREHLGLPMPEIDHPLMQTPLAKPPPPDKRPVLPPDPLLDAVIAKARAQGFLPPEGGDDFAV